MEMSEIINILTLLVLISTGFFIYKKALEDKRLSFLGFYEIIQKHHSKEMTELRKEVFSQIEQKVEKAREQKKTLKEIDDVFHSRVS